MVDTFVFNPPCKVQQYTTLHTDGVVTFLLSLVLLRLSLVVAKESNDGVVYNDTCSDIRSNCKSKIESRLLSKYVDLGRLCINEIHKLSELLVSSSALSNAISGCSACTKPSDFPQSSISSNSSVGSTPLDVNSS